MWFSKYDLFRSEVLASDVSVIPNAVDSIRFRPLESDELEAHKQKSFATVRLKKDNSK